MRHCIALFVLIGLTGSARADTPSAARGRADFRFISRVYQDAMAARGLFDRLHDRLGFENAELLQETWAGAQVANDKLEAGLAAKPPDTAAIADAIALLHDLRGAIEGDLDAYEQSNAAFSRNATIATVVGLAAIAGIVILIVRSRRRRRRAA